jgi:hypothetical protein
MKGYLGHLLKQTGMVIGPAAGSEPGPPETGVAETQPWAPPGQFHGEEYRLVEPPAPTAAPASDRETPSPVSQITEGEPVSGPARIGPVTPRLVETIAFRATPEGLETQVTEAAPPEIQKLTEAGITMELQREVRGPEPQPEEALPGPASHPGQSETSLHTKAAVPGPISRAQIFQTTLQRVRQWVAQTPEGEAQSFNAVDPAFETTIATFASHYPETVASRAPSLVAGTGEPARPAAMLPAGAAEPDAFSGPTPLGPRQPEHVTIVSDLAKAPIPLESEEQTPAAAMSNFQLSIGTISLTIEEPREEPRQVRPTPPSPESRGGARTSRSRLSRHYLRIR